MSVALGRVKDAKDLQVINFNPALCNNLPRDIFDYYNEPSMLLKMTLECCKQQQVQITDSIFSAEEPGNEDTGQSRLDTSVHLSDDSEFDMEASGILNWIIC